MRLKKLEVSGFKSFAQRTEIVFNDGITGIVGPNGSGKSNIGDAVRWVLGEQSAKSLRGASMQDVIFNGTQKRKPQSQCEVSLVFDNEDRKLQSDYSEVRVTRRVYRSGEGEYFLNGAACRLKDIVDLFRDTGIGREGYSIIGQGKIDDILSRRSEDRRQVFEEAAGIVKFRARKEEADRKLQRTMENADRVDDILEELNRQLGPLERQAKAAREYIELSGELKGLDMNLFLIRTDRARARLAELDAELTGLQSILTEAEQALESKAAERDRVQEAIADLESKISGARDGLMLCAEDVHEAQNVLTQLQSRRDTRQENRDRLLREREETETQIAALEESLRTGETELTRHRQLLEDAREALRQAESESADRAAKQETAENTLETHKAELLEAMNRRSDVRNNETRLTTMRQQMSDRLTELESSGESMAAEEERLRGECALAEERLAQEQTLRDTLTEELQTRREAFNAADSELIVLRREAEALVADLHTSESRHKVMSEYANDMDGYNQPVRQAIQYARQHQLKGVHGVLSQLIRVPKEYETALDMALGGAMQNIVTEDEETAKQLIEHLRRNHLGRATFLPISTIRGKNLSGNERGCLRLRGCVGVASELVQFDEKYRGIVENLLGRTVIAEDLNTGIPIMRAGNHAFRLVTLEGDVMHSGGSMTGGSTKTKATNLFSREREIRELALRLTALREQVKEKQALLNTRQTEKEALRAAVNSALEKLHQQEIAVAREQEHLDNANDELEAHRGRMEETAAALEQLRDSIAEIDLSLQEISRLSDTESGDQTALEARTAELQQSVNDARRLAGEAAEQVVLRRLQLNDLEHEADSMIRDRNRAELDIDQYRQNQERRAEQLAEMDTLDAEDAAAIAGAEAEIEKRRLAQTRQEAVIRSLEETRNGEQGRLKDILLDVEALHQSVSRDSDHVHRLELSRSKVDNDLRQQQERIWNTYEATYADAETFREEHFDVLAAEKRVTSLNGRIRALGPVNVNAVEEYAETKARFDDMTTQQADLRKAEADLRALIEELLKNMETIFVDNFTKLQGYFSETFVKLFGGGKAELKLTDPDDPLNCGIEVNAQPPGKKLQLLSLLSGGERALTAIAILFAMLKLKPTPFCILDEIEAALDDANIGYYADYLQEFSRSTQFIVVTHRKGTMERCDSLYGVSMEEQGVSKMASVALKDYTDDK